MANFNFNKVILGGRLTADPELKQTSDGKFFTSFSLAVNRPGKDSETDFINVVAWRERAEFVCKYFKKGSSMCVVGSIKNRTWTDNNGQKRYATDVVANEVNFVDSKSEVSAPNVYPQMSQAAPPTFEEIGKDDDLPF